MSKLIAAMERLRLGMKNIGVASEQASRNLILFNIAQIKAELADPKLTTEERERLIKLLAHWESRL